MALAWLTVYDGPDKGQKVEIKLGINLIGREASTCNLVLTDAKVSRVHARVVLLPDATVQIEDCSSTNGTYVRDKKIYAPVILIPGDVIGIGNCQIKFTKEPKPMSYFLRGGGVYEPAESYTRALHLSQGTICIGRDPSNDFVLEHPMVSRYHARIVLQAGRCFIYDLNTTNGTYVNGERVIKLAELFPASLIQICGYQYFFDGQTLIEYDETTGKVRLEINQLNKLIGLPGGEKRQLLNNINLVIEPREFVAILGGSGTGKSTLMGALTAMNPATSGKVLVNGRNLYKEYNSFRTMIGYVPQDDIVHRELTIKEVLTYSARLRMSDDISENEIITAVQKVLADLELIKFENVLVKDLSGGQRKRVSIGVELLTEPSLFFLDEPTSGLDPGLEKTMMELLRKLANQGHTVVLVTHATFNINLCDKVIFLAEGGQLAFFGTPNEAMSYFQVEDFAEIYKKVAIEGTSGDWSQKFVQSNIFNKYIQNKLSKNFIGTRTEEKRDVTCHVASTRISSLKQWRILTERYMRIMSKDRRNLLLLFLQPVVIAVIIVLVFFHNAPLFRQSKYQVEELKITQQVIALGQFEIVQQKSQEEAGRRSDMSVCVVLMVITAIWFGTSNAVREIAKEGPVYKRERLVKLRIAPYLMSKVAVLLLVCLIQSVLLVVTVFTGLGLPKILPNIFALLLISISSMMMGLMVSAVVENLDKASSSVQLLLVPQIILSGAIIPMSEVKPELFQNIFYLAVSKWGYELVGGGICRINEKVSLPRPLEELSGNFANHWMILIGFTVVLYFVTTMVLLRKDKQLHR